MKKRLLLLLIALLSRSNLSLSQSLAAAFENIAQEYDMMGGALVVFCKDQISTSCYYGKSDLLRDMSVDTGTRFRIASISKTVTAMAIMQLTEQGILSLDTDIGSILGFYVRNPNYPDKIITVRMLLSHTSSIVDGSTYSAFLQATVNSNPVPGLNEILVPGGTYYTANQFNNQLPGTWFNYANVNYVILGTIIEKVSGIRFDMYCREYIFEPLGLDASFNVNDLSDINDVAVLYRKNNGVWTPQIDNYAGIEPVFANLSGYVPGTNGGRFGPQGGLRISAEDLATLMMCLFNPGTCMAPILSAQSAADMMSEQWTYNGNNGNNYYGLFRSWGLGIHRVKSVPGGDYIWSGNPALFGHTGEAYGLVSDAYYDTTRKAGFVFITNGVGTGYQSDAHSAYYTVEQEVFRAVEHHVDAGACAVSSAGFIPEDDKTDWIYPNPVSGDIHISISQFNSPVCLKLQTLYGSTLIQKQITSPETTISLSGVIPGTYLLRINERAKIICKL